MDNLLTREQIEKTDAYIYVLTDLQKQFAVKRSNREILTNAYHIAKNGGAIPSFIFGYNLNILNELLK